MNIKQIYDKAAGLPAPESKPETDISAQIVINDAYAQWLQNQFTVELLDFLQNKCASLIGEAINCAGEPTKTEPRLHKTAIIKEILEYARRDRSKTKS